LGLITRWLGGGKPLLFQEFGLPVRPPGWPAGGTSGGARLFDEGEGQAFYQRALDELRRERFLGAFGWCANDYAEPLWAEPPLAANEHERFFGLFRADGRPKLSLEPLTVGASGALPPPRGYDWIDAVPEQFYDAPLATLRRLYGRFTAL
jgi:hypothetical protein